MSQLIAQPATHSDTVGLLALLDDQDHTLITYALTNLNQLVHQLWPDLPDHLVRMYITTHPIITNADDSLVNHYQRIPPFLTQLSRPYSPQRSTTISVTSTKHSLSLSPPETCSTPNTSLPLQRNKSTSIPSSVS